MTVLATIIVLGVLITVHELGHFLAAKAVGIEVQKFSIGLGPRIWGVKKGETEYILSAIPLGGFVKMGGMADKVMERVEGGPVETNHEPSSRSFDGKPIWARAVVISAGVVMNLAFALAAYIGSAAIWGLRAPATTTVGEVMEGYLPPGTEALASMRPGARIVSIGGETVEDWGEVELAFVRAEPGPLTIELADPAQTVEIHMPSAEDDRIRAVRSVRYWQPPVVESVTPGSPAEKVGVEAGDLLTTVDGVQVQTWDQFVDEIGARPGRTIALGFRRDGRAMTRNVTVDAAIEQDPVTGEQREVGKVGIWVASVDIAYHPVGPIQATRIGWQRTVGTTRLILDFVRDLLTGDVSPRFLGSIITVGQASGSAASMGLESFLAFMALFSINLAVLNLLPIPILDGGHLVFLAVEAVKGKALTLKQRMRLSQVGLIVILGIQVFALSNDILRLLGL